MYNGKKVIAIILAAGSGKRMGIDEKKQFIKVHDKELFLYSLDRFSGVSYVDNLILVTVGEDIDRMRDIISTHYSTIRDTEVMDKVAYIIAGGEERYLSVRNAISEIRDNFEDDSIILVHDGARPLVSEKVITRVVEKASVTCTVPGVQCKDTIRVVDRDMNVIDTPDRSSLYAIQTPQGAPLYMFKSAYDKYMEDISASILNITDDAMLIEHYLGISPSLVEGDYENIKVTTREDLDIIWKNLA